MITVSRLIDELGYTKSTFWKVSQPDERNPLCASGVVGSYMFRTAPTTASSAGLRKAVVVSEANTLEDAREIRKKLWNLGNVAFVMIFLPSQVRIYSGFSFHSDDAHDVLMDVMLSDMFEAMKSLSTFHSSEIDSGNIWHTHARKLKIENRIDRHLLQNLEKLDEYLVKEKQLNPASTHSVIGKFIYFSYLRDRRILSDEWLLKNGIEARSIFGRTTTLADFMHLSALLDRRFEGTIFPFVPDGSITDDVISLISGVFWGDEPLGQLSLDFSLYDFSYIPIELLSSIYEQFLHVEGKGDKVGAYYTPEPLADYVISEIDGCSPLTSSTKVLDPCCGSGVFLVLVYRKLIEMELEKDGRQKLSPDILKNILLNNIYGIERNDEACLVTQFSLILTLLSFLDPPDLHQNEDFKFPELLNTNIINCDFFDDKRISFPFKFDWVIGNPPWFEVDDFEEEYHVVGWIERNKRTSPVARNRVCEAFTWKAAEFLSDDGVAGLIVHATSLTNKHSLRYRQSFFKNNTVVKITNFSNLAYILFEKRAEAPAVTILYRKNTSDYKPDIIHFAPFVYNQIPIRSLGIKYSWIITVYESDIQTIPYERIHKDHANIWKLALWGNYRDHKNIERLRRIFSCKLSDLVKERKWSLTLGLQIRPSFADEDLDHVPALAGQKILNTKKIATCRSRFIIPNQCLEQLKPGYEYVRKGRKNGLKIIPAPHLVMNVGYARYSDEPFIVPHPQIAISCPSHDKSYLLALSLLLNSSFTKYILFFNCASWGIDRSIIGLKEAEALNIPRLDDDTVRLLANEYENIYKKEQDCFGEWDIQDEVDSIVEALFDVPPALAASARDFVRVRLQVNKGKLPKSIMAPPDDKQLAEYCNTLLNQLNIYAGIPHKIVIFTSRDFAYCEIEPSTESSYSIRSASDSVFQKIWLLANKKCSQWVYIQKSVRIFDGERVTLLKPRRSIDWNQNQAFLDSDDVIAEILDHAPREAVYAQ